MRKSYADYKKHLQQVHDLSVAAAILSWDKEVNMPINGAGFRAQQVATLNGLAHEQFTDPDFGTLINHLLMVESDPQDKRNLERSKSDFQKATCLDRAFVERKSKIVSIGYHKWLAARKENDFSIFQPALAQLITLKREEADKLGYADHPYDALIDQFEPGYKSAQLDALFEQVKTELVAFVRDLRAKPTVDDSFLYHFYPKDKQWSFSLDILKNMGYDFNSGRQDISPHPFTISFSPNDVRVTTQVNEQNFATTCWSSIHEGGHALYEQGLPAKQYGLPLGQACSLGIHESQSRLWENQIGRSYLYWQAMYPNLQKLFPEQLGQTDLDAFFKGINKIEPHPIRIESDELHYHFHILIRYELEKGLMEGSLEVADLPQAWNSKYKDYLDVDIKSDNEGCLQDIHWAHGSIGYFPTYSLGSFYAAQFFAQAKKDIPNLEDTLKQGDCKPLLDWLRINIFAHGRYYLADELCEKVTGERLNFRYFMDYAKAKYAQVYL